MKFLNKQRDEPRPYEGNLGRRSQHKDKQQNAHAEEISRYFASNDFAGARASQAYGSHPYQTDASPELIAANLGHPIRPFLGFGSHGPNSSSPTKEAQYVRPVHISNPRHQPAARTLVQSSSYLTWSESDKSVDRARQPKHHVPAIHNERSAKPRSQSVINHPDRGLSRHLVQSPEHRRASSRHGSGQADEAIDLRTQPPANRPEAPQSAADDQSSLNRTVQPEIAAAKLRDTESITQSLARKIQHPNSTQQADAVKVDDSKDSPPLPIKSPGKEDGQAQSSHLIPTAGNTYLDEALDLLLQANAQPFSRVAEGVPTPQVQNKDPARNSNVQESPGTPIQIQPDSPIQQAQIPSSHGSGSHAISKYSSPATGGYEQTSTLRDRQPSEIPSNRSWLPDSHLGRHVYAPGPASRLSTPAGSGFDYPVSVGSLDCSRKRGGFYERQAVDEVPRPLGPTHGMGPPLHSNQITRQGLQESRWHNPSSHHSDWGSERQYTASGALGLQQNLQFIPNDGDHYQQNGSSQLNIDPYSRTGADFHSHWPRTYDDTRLYNSFQPSHEEPVDSFTTPAINTIQFQPDQVPYSQTAGGTMRMREDHEDNSKLSKFWAPNRLY